ncbi:MAG: PD40 domain-containing protein [Actinobacteria bacterium]|nr:PD40 domain-containing protein [Actinomycetota bacterium]
MKRILSLLATIGLIAMLAMPGPVAAKQFSAWVDPVLVPGVNTTYVEGCSMQSPDGLSLYFASNRDGFQGDTRNLDIWVAHRAGTGDAWGAPENLGDTINSTFNELCPTPVRGKGLFFISAREGNGDIFFSRLNPAHGWTTPVNLGSNVNSPTLGEAGPSYFEADGHAFLYFSSGPDIYASEQASDGSWGLAEPVAELNGSTSGDFRLNVRKDGLEIVFDSNRSDTYGLQDLYTATRRSVDDPWSTPSNLGNVVNTTLSEVRGSFSWDARVLYFGRTSAVVVSDIYFTTRTR